MEKLKLWQLTCGLNWTQLAEKLGITKQYLSRIKTGCKRPADELKLKIMDITDGAVMPADWFDV